jgi:hypothetical protein
MISLANLMTQIEHQHDMLAAHPVEPDTAPTPAHYVDLDAMIQSPLTMHPVVPAHPNSGSHACKVPYEHDCYLKNYGVQEGELITLWAYLQYPEDRVRQNSANVRRFRRAKEVVGWGWGMEGVRCGMRLGLKRW